MSESSQMLLRHILEAGYPSESKVCRFFLTKNRDGFRERWIVGWLTGVAAFELFACAVGEVFGFC